MVQARNPSVLRMTTKTLRLRVRDEGRFCLFASRLTVDRHGLRPRDDKMCHGALCLSLRGGQNGRRGNPSCLGEGSVDFKIDHIMCWHV